MYTYIHIRVSLALGRATLQLEMLMRLLCKCKRWLLLFYRCYFFRRPLVTRRRSPRAIKKRRRLSLYTRAVFGAIAYRPQIAVVQEEIRSESNFFTTRRDDERSRSRSSRVVRT